MSTLYERLSVYEESDFYGFHMPGHKRNHRAMGLPAFYGWDITEIEGFDNLYYGEGILLEAMERAAKLYGADETHFLVGGSSGGMIGAIAGHVIRDEKILVARNCHKSVYFALEITGAKPVYLYPKEDEKTGLSLAIDSQDVRRALEDNPDIRAVVITSPTYEGVVSDIESISEEAHRRNVPLIVDEAHGAHLGFHDFFPGSAIQRGGDVVVQSTHKTLPALTQTALIHFRGDMAPRDRVRESLRMFQTSSPSYILMGSIDCCMRMLEKNGRQIFDNYVNNLCEFREKSKALERLDLWECPLQEKSKIVISTHRGDISGKALYERLLEPYHLQMEMYQMTIVLGMTSPGDTREGFERLGHALRAIDQEIFPGEVQADKVRKIFQSKMRYTPLEARELAHAGKTESLFFSQAAEHVAAEYVYIYPPGIPMVVPGEIISEEIVSVGALYEREGYRIRGNRNRGRIEVLKNG